MDKLKYNNKILSDYVLSFLIKNKIVSSDANLEYLHNFLIDENMLVYEDRKKYSKTHPKNYTSGLNAIQKFLYTLENDKEWNNIYIDLLKHIYKNVGFNFYFQKTPTIRVHCPNSDKDNHYPMFHNDIILGHPPQEVNIWMSLTKNKNTGFRIISEDESRKIMSKYSKQQIFDLAHGSEDFNKKCLNSSEEVKSDINCVYLFNSVRIHSATQREKDTRLSIDVRINPVDEFKDGYVGTGMTKAEFKPGGKFGYNLKSIEEML